MAQAIGSFLHGYDVASLSGSPMLDRAMPAVNQSPRHLREWVYSIGGMTEAVSRKKMRRIGFDRIAAWLTELMPAQSYPAAFIGSSNGGLVHLAAALRVPWLPQTFLSPVRHFWSDPDDAKASFAWGCAVADDIVRNHPNLSVHHMHDPNQDRLMLKTMAYFRLKYTSLPLSYREFLSQSLPEGSTLFVDDCTQRWPVTRISDRSVFQFGAVGGADTQEYLHGGVRVREYLARYGIDRARWDPPEPNDTAPEAEWGFEPALIGELSALADTHRWRLIRIQFENPEALSWLAARTYEAWYRELGCTPDRLLVDSFVLLDPYRTIRLRAVPLWLLFGVERSAALLDEFLDCSGPFDEIGLMLFSHGTEGVGIASIDCWRSLLSLARRRGYFLGVDESRYPRDFATFTRFHDALARLGLPFELPAPLSLPRFEQLLRQLGPQFGINIVDLKLN